MNINKNTLFVIDFDVDINHLIKGERQIKRENITVLQSGLLLSPFDDLMRSIIIAVYKHNIDEIVVVGSPKENRLKSSFWTRHDKEWEGKFQEKAQSLNYLFENCKPEFHENNLSEWFEGGATPGDGVRNTVSVISQHPLIPADIKITEITAP
ncbi:hypothetical protein D1B33_17895 [Lysinibacillus yapensis]|uniref:Uncharacterized protein n=1 Tax=Ureibacillus yapensis TaxID=2304605 RepID=A0A396SHS8_9BACL|nr:hypothetical protein [Lysinibacillus yapensis]RHW31382.1 hypothetical protein D1B33_17895 [Lysinibacillus yapensis]